MKRSFYLAFISVLFLSLSGAGSLSGSVVDFIGSPEPEQLLDNHEIVTEAITGTFCQNSAIVVNFTATGVFDPANVFAAELSDENGSFASPVVLGTLPAAGEVGSTFIYGQLPPVLVPGSGYRIRVVASSPGVIGSDNGTDVVVKDEVAPPIPTVSVNGPLDFCFGSATTFLTSSVANGNLWFPGGTNTNPFLGVVSSGCYYTQVTAPNGCTSSSYPACINVNTPIFTFLAYFENDEIVTTADTSVIICEGDSAQIGIVIQGGVAPYDIFYTKDGIGVEVAEDVGEPYGADHVYRFYVTEPGSYSVIGLTDDFPTNCGSNGNSGLVTVNVAPRPVTDFQYNPFCGSPSQPPVPASGFLGGGVFSFEVDPGDGAQIDPATGVVTGISIGSTYTIRYTVQGPYCEATSTTSFVVDSADVVQFSIEPFCPGQPSGQVQPSPGFVSGGVFSFAEAPGDNAQVNPVTGIVTNVSANTTYYIMYTSPAGICQASYIDTVSTLENPVVTGIVENTLCGQNTGSISTSVTGGNGGYTYSWAPNGAVTPSIENLVAGAYTVTVTDASGCKDDSTFTIINTNQPELEFEVTNATCGNSNGAIDLTINAGIGGFAILWNGTIASEDLSDLAAGSYSVEVTDSATTCVVTGSVTVLNEGAPQASYSVTNSLCAQSIGAIDVTVTGGTGTITHSWNTGATTEDLIELPAGTYVDTIRDENNCQVILTATIVNSNQLTASAVAVDPTCGNPNGGSIDVSVQGGQPPFSYSWSPNTQNITQDAANLAAGTYTVIVRGSSQCSDTLSVTLNPAVNLNVTVNQTDATCGNSDGAIRLQVTGGSGQYIYVWSDSTTADSLVGIPAGEYSVLVRDAADTSCTTTASVNIINSNMQSLEFVTENTSCTENTGSIDLTVVGGTGPFSFTWTGGINASTEDITNLAAGEYNVSVYDSTTTCEVSGSATINFINPPVITATVVNTSCGRDNGLIDVTINGGTAPIAVTWSPNGEETQDLINLPAGNYTINVLDSAGCTASRDFVIAPSVQPTTALSFINPTCGSDTGSINLTVTNATAPLVYTWRKNDVIYASTEDLANLSPGTYRVVVTDAIGCIARDTAILIYDNQPVLSVAVTNTPCGLSEGAIDLTIDEGTPAFTISWTGPNEFTASTEDITDLAVGCYNATVTDQLGCEVSIQACVENENSPVISFDLKHPSCNLENGIITASISGGVAPYTLEWADRAETDTVLTDLAEGSYTLIVYDVNGCEVRSTATLTNTGLPLINGTQVNADCGVDDGAISVTVNGVNPPFSYSWTGPDGFSSDSASIADLAVGTYEVTVTDSTGCQATGSFTIVNENAPQIAYTQVNPSCGNSNGEIDITVTGEGTYSYAWTGVGVQPDTEDQTGLAAGSYKVVVTEVPGGCTDSLTVTLINSNQFTVDAVVTNTTCGNDNGSIALSITGGTPAFQINWSNSATTDSIGALAAGSYSVTILDDAGCTYVDTFVVDSVPAPTVSGVTTDATCGACNGAIDLEIAGGTTPYTISWDNGATDADLSNLCAGGYTVTVSDGINCVVQATFTIQTTQPPSLSFTQTNTTCGSDTGSVNTTVTGGIAPYVFSWTGPDGFVSADEDINSLATGVYNLTVTDSVGCEAQGNVTIVNSDQPTISFEVTNASCGAATGAINVTVIGGLGSNPDNNPGIPNPGALYDVFSWTGPNGYASNDEDITGLEAGTYVVTVYSGLCVTIDSVQVFNTDAPSASLSLSRDTICRGEPVTLTIELTGDAPFTFSYLEGSDVRNVTSFANSTFTTIVNPDSTTIFELLSLISDSDPACPGNLLISTDTVVVNPSPDRPVITASGPLEFCAGDSVTLTSSYQTGNNWSIDGETGQSVVVSSIAQVYVSVSNEFGCVSYSDTISVQSLSQPNVSAGADVTICQGQSTQLQGSGATQYEWFPSIGLSGSIIANPTASPLITTTYVLTGTNQCGTGTDTITVTVNPSVSANIGEDRTVCAGEEVTLTVGEAVDGATYSWGPSSVIVGSSTGSSATVVTDNPVDVYVSTVNTNGCEARDTVRLSIGSSPAAPVLSALGDTSFCAGGSVVLQSSIGTFVEWLTEGNVVARDVNQLEVTESGRYTVRLISGECPATSNAINVVVNELPAAQIIPSGNTSICEGSCVELTAASTSGTISWITPAGNESSASVQACEAGVYTLNVAGEGCSNTASITIVSNPLPNAPVISPEGPLSICENETVTLNSNYPEGNQWLLNGSHLSGFTSSFITINEQGDYSVRYTDANGCSVVSAPVSISVKPISNLEIFASNTTICSGSPVSITLTASTGFVSYQWNNGGDSQIIEVNQSGEYTVVGTNSLGCTNTASITIEESPAIELDLYSPVYFDDFNITQNGKNDGSIDLTVNGGTAPYSYIWSNMAETEDLANLSAGTYEVTVTDALGCSTTANITLKEPGQIQLPNGFTPNGDGFNDFYVIKGIQGYPGNQINVFNRWGNLVFSASNYTNDWNGISNDGNALPDGTYYIVVDLKQDGRLIEGFIDLRRK